MNECILVVDDDAEIVGAIAINTGAGRITGASRPTTVSRPWTCVWTRR